MDTRSADISLQPATLNDVDLLLRIYADTRREEIQAWGWPPAQQEAFVRMQFHARRSSYGAGYPQAKENIILAGGVPAGTILVDCGEVEIRLVDIALLADYRNRGIGTQLISGLIRQAMDAGLPLRLSVLTGNPAMRLYQRLGFTVTGSDGLYHEMEYNGPDLPPSAID